MKNLRTALWLGLGLGLITPASAQVLEPEATFPEPFSRLAGLRELDDGRLIIADRLELHVSYLDFASGSVTQISREGEGPGEYRQPLGLHPYPDGRTLLTDIGNMRISRIDERGTIDETWPMMTQGETGMTFIRPSGVDNDGYVYYSGLGITMRTAGGGRSGSAAPPDSSHIIKVNLETGEADTVGYAYSEPATSGNGSIRVSRGGGGSFNFAGGLRPFPVADDWGVAPDGRVAVVRATEYRVDWYNPDGSMVTGAATPYEQVRVGRDEKNAWADAQAQNSVAMVMGGGGGGGGGSFQIPRPDIDEVEFPEVMPPFGRSAVSVAPNGDVWVQLNRPAGANTALFDIFGSDGQRIRQVELQSNRQLVGFGKDAVYAVAVDEDDLQWLERYPYPKN